MVYKIGENKVYIILCVAEVIDKMIEFKKNVQKELPYDRLQYIEFLYSEPSSVKWYGVSFQLDKEDNEISLKEFIEKYLDWFKNVISTIDDGSFWVVNQDKNDLDWFPNEEDNLSSLRTLFKQNGILSIFKGALLLTKNDLLKFSEDLISYPYAVFNEDGLFYMNLDISHSELPFIIKILDHLNIDLLSTNKGLLREVVSKNSSNIFNIKEYRGTSL